MNAEIKVIPSKNDGNTIVCELVNDELDISKRITLQISMFIDKKQRVQNIRLTKYKKNGNEVKDKIGISFSTQGFENFAKIVDFIKNFIENNPDTFLQKLDGQKVSLVEESDIIGYINTEQGKEKVKELIKADKNIFKEDIISIAKRRSALKIFRGLLDDFNLNKEKYQKENESKRLGDEQIWQDFFENNKWIFGVALETRCLINVGDKLEEAIVGHTFNQNGRRTDGFLQTRAMFSQTVLVEIKPSTNELSKPDPKGHKGIFIPHEDLMIGISQIQKTTREFIDRVEERSPLKDKNGNDKGYLYNSSPRSFLIIGRDENLKNGGGVNEDKIHCFELFRRSLTSPEIITYDELYERAKFIVDEIEVGQEKK